eukprot:9381378-Lingulodinium_polyedra.AAC.1
MPTVPQARSWTGRGPGCAASIRGRVAPVRLGARSGGPERSGSRVLAGATRFLRRARGIWWC